MSLTASSDCRFAMSILDWITLYNKQSSANRHNDDIWHYIIKLKHKSLKTVIWGTIDLTGIGVEDTLSNTTCWVLCSKPCFNPFHNICSDTIVGDFW